jgi:hypothetical protein
MADERHLKKLGEGVNAWNQWRELHPEILPDLRKADLHEKVLTGIDFRHTNLDDVNLCNANICAALLDNASLCGTNLTGAKVRHAHLYRTCFKETILQRTNLHDALLLETLFLNVDLSEALNLETVIHLGPSTIGVDTIQRSKGNISVSFLRGSGISEPLLTCIHSSGRAPFEYATCFISYSSYDRRFVENLYQDLRREGVICWYAPESMKAGEKFPASITEAVQCREKVLVVLSKHALVSNWVKREVALARQKEGKGKREVLVPIRLDSAILNTTTDWAAIRKQRHIRSFENWQQPSRYQKMFRDLLNDLRKQ